MISEGNYLQSGMSETALLPTSLKLCYLEENISGFMIAGRVSFVSEKSSFPLISVKIYSDLHELQTFETLMC